MELTDAIEKARVNGRVDLKLLFDLLDLPEHKTEELRSLIEHKAYHL